MTNKPVSNPDIRNRNQSDDYDFYTDNKDEELFNVDRVDFSSVKEDVMGEKEKIREKFTESGNQHLSWLKYSSEQPYLSENKEPDGPVLLAVKRFWAAISPNR